MSECIECGDEIPEGEAVWGQGTPDEEEFAEMVDDGEEKAAEDLFAFDDGPYCDFGCLMAGGD